MKATLFTPNNQPHVLTADEVEQVNCHHNGHLPYYAALYNVALFMGLGKGANVDILAHNMDFTAFVAENAADYARPCPSAIADLTRLTGIDWTGENQPYGPILIIEA